jgi:serine/threonine-protein kinase
VQFAEGLVVADRFRLIRQLGKGGMGAVWLAQHIGLDVPCAVKFISEEAARSKDLRARFEREAKAAALLRTPHVVHILDHGVWQDVPYIAMEYLEGGDLGQRLARVRVLSPTETLSIAVQVGRALAKAHTVGLIHRDLKPANIFLVRDEDREIAKVLDFGVAKVKENDLDGSTKTGALLGTPYYMSPEQAKGARDIDHRSDLWALAVVVYQCLTGHLPFNAQALGELFVRIIVEPLPVPSQYAPVPAGFDGWWMRAAARNPAERFQTAKEFTDALSIALGVTAMQGVDIGSTLASRTSPSGAPPAPGMLFGGSQSGAIPGGTPMPYTGTPQPGTPLPHGMTPAGPITGAGPGTLPSGVAPTPLQQSISVATPPNSRRGVMVAVILGAIVLGSGGVLLAFRSSAAGPTKTTGAGSATAPVSAEAPPTATATGSAPPPASATVTATASAPEPPASAASAPAPSATVPGPLPGGAKKAGGPLPGKKGKADCDPNYYLDAEGNKHFKPECFK